MQGEKLRGTKLRSSRIFSIVKQDFETLIVDVKTELKDSFELVCIETSPGKVECKYYKAEEADKGIILEEQVGTFKLQLIAYTRVWGNILKRQV